MEDINELVSVSAEHEKFNMTHGVLCARNHAKLGGLTGYKLVSAVRDVIVILRADEITVELSESFGIKFNSHFSRKKDTNSTAEGYTVVVNNKKKFKKSKKN